MRQAAARYGYEIAAAFQRRAADMWTYHARAKRACVLGDWIAGVPTEEIERRYSITPYQAVALGDIRGMADTTRFHLRSAFDIVSIVAAGRAPTPEAMDNLLRQLEIGLPVEALPLLESPLPLTRGEYLALARGSIRSSEALLSADRSTIAALIGQQRAEQLDRMKQRSVAPVIEA